jgi:porphobilinogen synthase
VPFVIWFAKPTFPLRILSLRCLSNTAKGIQDPIQSMPGQFQFSPDTLVAEAETLWSVGVPAVILFGLPDGKDSTGSRSWADDGIVQIAVKAIKDRLPDMVVMTDVCLCEYTDHGHCGVIANGVVDNDATLELLARQSVSHCRAGADFVAPSDMMDGRIGHIRRALDDAGFTDRGILSYAVKYASAFYGPFGMPRIRPPSSVIAPVIRWIRPMPSRPSKKRNWTLKKGRT